MKGWFEKAKGFFQKYGIYGSFLWLSYKTNDGQRTARILQDRLDHKTEQAANLTETLNLTERNLRSVIYNIAVASAELDDIPLPLWYKIFDPDEKTFKMVYLNHAYEDRFNINRVDYLGKRDFEITPTNVSRDYKKHDIEAFYSRRPIFVDEKTPNGVPIRVVKWRVDRGDNSFVYGMILSE